MHKSNKLIFPVESSDSYNDIVFILILTILPLPLCIIPFFFGVDEPVNINCPFSWRLSTSALVASQIGGTSCHSSINLGVSPCKIKDGFNSAIFLLLKLLAGSPTRNSLFEWNADAHVLPHHFGPSTQIAPLTFK